MYRKAGRRDHRRASRGSAGWKACATESVSSDRPINFQLHPTIRRVAFLPSAPPLFGGRGNAWWCRFACVPVDCRKAYTTKRSAHRGWQQAEFASILGDCPPCDLDAELFEFVADLVICQRVRFVIHQFLDDVLDAERGGEEIREGNDSPLREQDVLVRRGAADGRFVHAERLGDGRAGEWFQLPHAIPQEVFLLRHDILRDLLEHRTALPDA